MKDPVRNYEQYLLSSGVLKPADIERIVKSFAKKSGELQTGGATQVIVPDTDEEMQDVYAPW